MLFLFVAFCILQIVVSQKRSNVVRFDEIDTNGDRQITFDELKKWHKVNRIARNDKQLKELIQSRDRNKDGLLNIAEFVTLLLTRNPINQNEKLFESVDINGDGVITPTEALQSRNNGLTEKIMYEIFQLIDINNDNKITLAEMTSALNGKSGVQQKSEAQLAKTQNSAHQLMTLIDQDLDRKLSVKEVFDFANANTNAKADESKIKKEFKFIDANGDDFLTIAEIIKNPDQLMKLVHFREPPPVINN